MLTHCNTGSLATCGFGTALGRTFQLKTQIRSCWFLISFMIAGVIRTLHQNGQLGNELKRKKLLN